MRRRQFLSLVGGAAAIYPIAAHAQQSDLAWALVNRILRMQTGYAATSTGQFVTDIESQLRWTVQLPWTAGTLEQHRFDALRLLLAVPAITELALVDASGIEQLRVSRLDEKVVASKVDISSEPKFTVAMANKLYCGPTYLREPRLEPHMTLSIAGRRRDTGVSVAEINLKFLCDLLASLRLGASDVAYILDVEGRLIAHSEIGLMMSKTDMTRLSHVKAALAAGFGVAPQSVKTMQNIQGRDVLAAYAAVVPLGLVFVELPIEEVNALAQ